MASSDNPSPPAAGKNVEVVEEVEEVKVDNIYVSNHPVLLHKMTIMRSSDTCPGTFRSVLREVTYHLGYEATKALKLRSGLPVSVPLGKELTKEHENLRQSQSCGFKLVDKIALIPILRSGLGMTEAMLELLPNCAVHHIGMYRTPGIHKSPVQYFNRLPRGKCSSDVAYVLDPIVGSAATIMAVISILKNWGVPKIHIITVLASKQGLDTIRSTYPDVYMTVGIVDKELTSDGIVLPGMGDCGDRLFGTGNQQTDFMHDNGNGNGHSGDISGDDGTGTGTGTVSAGGVSGGEDSNKEGGNNNNNTNNSTNFETKRKRSASLELEMDNK